MIIDGVEVTGGGFVPFPNELKNYVDYVRERVPNVTAIEVTACPDGCVDVKYTAKGEKFERIRRITG